MKKGQKTPKGQNVPSKRNQAKKAVPTSPGGRSYNGFSKNGKKLGAPKRTVVNHAMQAGEPIEQAPMPNVFIKHDSTCFNEKAFKTFDWHRNMSWKSSDGALHPIHSMDIDHLLNAISYLRNRIATAKSFKVSRSYCGIPETIWLQIMECEMLYRSINRHNNKIGSIPTQEAFDIVIKDAEKERNFGIADDHRKDAEKCAKEITELVAARQELVDNLSTLLDKLA